MPKGELHVELTVNYADDDKLAHVSRGARLLYVDALLLSKRMLNDGVLTAAQVEKLAYPDRPPAARKQAQELVDSRAWRKTDSGYVISGWLKRNKSRAQILKERREAEANAILGNHKRWHVDVGKVDPKCPLCRTPDPEPDPQDDRPPDRGSETVANPTESPETETETETEKYFSKSPSPPLSSNGRARTEQLAAAAGATAEEMNSLLDQVRRDRPDVKSPVAFLATLQANGDLAPMLAALRSQRAERVRAATIRTCRHCDADGWRLEPGHALASSPYVRCDHTPARQEATP